MVPHNQMSFLKWDHFCQPEDRRELLFSEWVTHPHLALMGLCIKVLRECNRNGEAHFLVIWISSCFHTSVPGEAFGGKINPCTRSKGNLMKIHEAAVCSGLRRITMTSHWHLTDINMSISRSVLSPTCSRISYTSACLHLSIHLSFFYECHYSKFNP